jgi:hypothetical protein
MESMVQAQPHSDASPPVQETPPVVLRLRPAIELTDDQFFALCQQNRDVRIERTAAGDIIFLSGLCRL